MITLYMMYFPLLLLIVRQRGGDKSTTHFWLLFLFFATFCVEIGHGRDDSENRLSLTEQYGLRSFFNGKFEYSRHHTGPYFFKNSIKEPY